MNGARRYLGLLLLLAASPLEAQERRELTVEWSYSDEGEAVAKMPKFAWTSGDEILLLDERVPQPQRTLERIRASTGERRPATDASAALRDLKAQLGDLKPPDAMPWPDSFDRAGTRALFVVADDVFVLELSASRFTRLTKTPEKESVARLSPDGRRAAYVRGNDLYVCELATKKETRLTRDGSATTLNGALPWLYWEEVFNHIEDGYWWSEDSAAIAFLRSDESAVDAIAFPNFLPAVPEVAIQRYPKTGDPNPKVRVGIVDAGGGTTVWMNAAEGASEYVLGAQWLADSRRVAVQTTDRSQTRLDLSLVDRSDGSTRRILTETDDAWVDQKEIHFLDGGGKLLLSSERDGHSHLYRHAIDGSLINAVTRGSWSVRGPVNFYGETLGSAFVDEARGVVYFTALEKSPVERHLYRSRLDGSRMERISREDGTHQVVFSPDRRFYVDAYSSRSAPPSLSIREAGGAMRTVLSASRTESIAPFHFQVAELSTVPASDGFPMPARILKPRDFDPARKYPVILYVYGGPSSPTVSDSWDYSFAGNAYFDQILVNRGYVVASIDNRSATGMSKKLENTVLRRVWSDGELADMLDGVKWLKAQPWVDAARVGIWGWSGGGTSTLLAMTRSQEFKAGIAVAAVTDWRYYDTKFAETYMKTPAENPGGYENFSLVKRAKDLHGRLMLVFGSGDDNVHPQNSWAFLDELVKADKPVDLMVYPMRKHPIDDRPARIHLFQKMLEFWKLYL